MLRTHATFTPDEALSTPTPASFRVVQVLPPLTGMALDEHASACVAGKFNADVSRVLEHIHEHADFRCKRPHAPRSVRRTALHDHTYSTLASRRKRLHCE